MVVNKDRMNNYNGKILSRCKLGLHSLVLVRIRITSTDLIGVYRCKNCAREESKIMKVVSDEGNVN